MDDYRWWTNIFGILCVSLGVIGCIVTLVHYPSQPSFDFLVTENQEKIEQYTIGEQDYLLLGQTRTRSYLLSELLNQIGIPCGDEFLNPLMPYSYPSWLRERQPALLLHRWNASSSLPASDDDRNSPTPSREDALLEHGRNHTTEEPKHNRPEEAHHHHHHSSPPVDDDLKNHDSGPWADKLDEDGLLFALKTFYSFGWKQGNRGRAFRRLPSEWFGFKVFGEHLHFMPFTRLLTHHQLHPIVDRVPLKVIHLMRSDYFHAALSFFEAVNQGLWRVRSLEQADEFNLRQTEMTTHQLHQLLDEAIHRCAVDRFYAQDLATAAQLGLVAVHPVDADALLEEGRVNAMKEIWMFLKQEEMPAHLASALVPAKNFAGRSQLSLDARLVDHQRVLQYLLDDLELRKVKGPLHEQSLIASLFPQIDFHSLEHAPWQDCVDVVTHQISNLAKQYNVHK